MRSTAIMTLIKNADREGLTALLTDHPQLANEPIPLADNPALEHPLHRICDGVCAGLYSDTQAAEMARIFLAFGAAVDGNVQDENKDTPLIAAASLRADEVGILYIDFGANVHHRGCHGGTALHWAAWCGRDKLVERLLAEKIDINQRCIDFRSTPLLWAVHGYKFGGAGNRHRQVECARMLIAAGADKSIPNLDGVAPVQFLNEEDRDFKTLFNK